MDRIGDEVAGVPASVTAEPQILRVFVARVKPGREAEWNAMVDRQIDDDLRDRPGLIGWYRCRRLSASNLSEYLVVTIWSTRHHERLFAGASAHPVLPPGAEALLEDSEATEYEVEDSLAAT